MATFKDFRNTVKPNWCPGCGDFSVQAAIQRAAANVGYEPNELAVISGIGCSGRISGYINSYGFHGIHGRALPIAQGLKMANKDLKVIASGGDGDGFAIGSELWTTNWSNYYQPQTANNTVQVVDIQNDVKVSEIEVEQEPNSMVVDRDGMVWVLCDNGWEDTTFFLCKINPMLKQVEKTYTFAGGYPSHLCIDKTGTRLLFIDYNVCSMNINDETSLNTSFIAAEGRSFYNMVVNPTTGDLYVTDAKNYVQNGQVYRYSSDGVLLKQFSAGICPSAMVFN